MAWSKDGAIWAGGGNGTLLVSRDGGDSWERDPESVAAPTNFTRFIFDDSTGQDHAFLLGERGLMLRWSAVS